MRRILLACAILLSSCTDDQRFEEALDNMGFTNIRIDGYAFYGCGEGYNFHRSFHATNPRGKEVSGVVCCGILTGCTAKF